MEANPRQAMNGVLKTAVLAILRPLIRYLIGQGWTYGALADALKMVYVAEAGQHYGEAAGRPLTDSRISLLTGIHRKEVKRLRLLLEEHGERPMLRHGANIAAQVVAAWVSMAEYTDPAGQPRPLPLRSEASPSFEGLARRVKADMRPRAILDELGRVGVTQEQEGVVHLLRVAYISDLPEDQVAFLGENVGDHLRSAVHNLEGGEPFLERALYFDALPAAVLEEARPEIYRMSERLLREAHQRLNAAESPEGPQRRLRLGVYYYEEDAAVKPTEEPAAVDEPHA
ncbi:conserved protein of unknown function [Acidithiobacillus ferrivorans]|uniref:Uncharacterized protein n=4 Tax=Acidithiobacillus ferrivorans TaxID=160808 RepID=G0JND3_9PROT|nr:DUF6502 family protein [Acidithiobacillus ferrivorans]AEM47163.1 hypothetical protein Acife_0993 [Acidithiobacillus ferrivorans SS3]AEM47167.1 hypothetical protein Acife_0997 [Acidithiobacillus ferrivorans SS3]CDQ12019.1 conserved hypothetical protein [Acidithiobacillus ferrivorans]SMH67424.1 conserved protein of unknown function [Acidithiobacillus ferrivorans]SMH67428.1 conserved protein of unknown function [Acidithiobacillus ferrivorans]